ncbi:hypothetical protein B0H17DRAFT_1328606 [Mycena rosella]|uniref:Asl1-like glycosyl hydrolase catalytic domain-containing protein n=1 Tax=Mycena rosella TaxID=1033263 RepID=A0AAD7DUB7_MYCRO|nr:hypothetical protein B0H17DRAFT_1328606 [Mycena rosella]
MVSRLSTYILISSALAALAALPTAHATARGLPWTTNINFASALGSQPKVSWYHHWEYGAIPQMPAKNEFVPMFWDTAKYDKWSSRKAEMAKNTPKYLLGFNKPHISGQANMSPADAAAVWMTEIHPWAAKGVKLGNPAVAWNLDWTAEFLAERKKRGSHVDFVTYGSYQDLATFKKFVSTAHSRFGYNIWVTEVGITTSSNPSTSQVKQFMMNAFAWIDSTGYVDRASWFSCFTENSPPDSYATAKNALFQVSGALNDMGYWYGIPPSSAAARK